MRPCSPLRLLPAGTGMLASSSRSDRLQFAVTAIFANQINRYGILDRKLGSDIVAELLEVILRRESEWADSLV